MDKIILNGCRFYGYHGAFSEEQTLGQIFVVDLELAVDLTKESQSDNLEDTVHYGLVFEAVQKQVEDKITRYGNCNSKEIEKSDRRFYGFK